MGLGKQRLTRVKVCTFMARNTLKDFSPQYRDNLNYGHDEVGKATEMMSLFLAMHTFLQNCGPRFLHYSNVIFGTQECHRDSTGK